MFGSCADYARRCAFNSVAAKAIISMLYVARAYLYVAKADEMGRRTDSSMRLAERLHKITLLRLHATRGICLQMRWVHGRR